METHLMSVYQMDVKKCLLGYYLAWHFIMLLPDSKEVFDDVISNKEDLPGYRYLTFSSIIDTEKYIFSLIIASLVLATGIATRPASLWIFIGWVTLYNRNPFISNPSLAYIGWLLLSFVLNPNSRRYSKELFYGFWLINGLSYTASGLHKLQCPSWVDGTALEHVLTSVLSRNNILTDIMLSMPPIFLKIGTWVSLFGEISFLFLGMFKNLRFYYWTFFLLFHIGIIATVNFTDLTLGMIVAHIFLFDPEWFKKRKQKSSEWIFYSGITFLIMIMSATVYVKNKYVQNLLNNITIDAASGYVIAISGIAIPMIIERLYPDIKLENTPGWWGWAISVNLLQLTSAILASYTWEMHLYKTSLDNSFKLSNYVGPFPGAIIAYIINQWLFYWWHYMRHQMYPLWIICHQFHHSAKRIETITSFYKHPLEIVLDSVIMAILVFPVLGLTTESNIWLSIFSAFGEYFYHMNIKTPKIVGYFFQRPESHRMHHKRDSRLNCPNNSDMPLWDMLNDTFVNPDTYTKPTGFTNETKRVDMLMFKDVISKRSSVEKVFYAMH